MNHNRFNPSEYIEALGAWSRESQSMKRAYLTGFIVSLALTAVAFALVGGHEFGMQATLVLLAVLALVQFATQLRYFLHLHLRRDQQSQDKIVVLGFAALVVFILVAGSLWIMMSLNDRMMPSGQEMETFMQSQQGI